ncbi:MAG: sulfotransferase domain-containing protein [Desulfovibrionaceae bacterium]|nr:sulfotransferase domain-containing protein [Desulfovibrionaceae bacterium]
MNLNFILCPSYHGATLLAILLDRHSKLTCLGDTVPRFRPDEVCTCKETFGRCPFWRELTARVRATPGSDPERLLPERPAGTIKTMALTGLGLAFGPNVWALARGSRAFLETHLAFRRAACELQKSEEFVDGEKSVGKVLTLKSMLGRAARTRIIHLVRDPRGFHNSRLKYVAGADPQNTARAWRHHRWIAMLKNPALGCEYLLLRYEDLCRDPAAKMREVLAFLGQPFEPVCEAPYDPANTHTIGNKMRKTFDGTIVLDEAWRQNLDPKTQDLVADLSEPLFSRLGYSRTRA